MPRPPNIPKRRMSISGKVAPQPNQVATLLQQGLALHQQGRFKEAQAFYEHILDLQSNHFDAMQLLGTLSAQTKQFIKAVEFLVKALQINPNHAEANNNLGNALKELGRFDEALVSYEKAISINPDYAEAYSNRGNILKELKRLDEALISHDKAICLQNNYAEAYSNRGNVLLQLERLEEALASYARAITLKPDYAEPNWNLSLGHLLLGNFEDGWRGYEWRWKIENISQTAGIRSFPQPLWLGVPSLQGKTILLYAEQGLGDTIQFCRYIPYIAQLGAKVILEVHPPLVRLLQNLEGVSQIIAKGAALPQFDYQCPLMSLPLAFKTALETIPPIALRITSDINKVTKWQTQLGEKTKPRVGIVWSGSAIHKNDHNRSLTLSQLLPYLPSKIEFICLQKEIRETDKALLAQHGDIKHFGEALEDFTDTAALCELMDVVMSIDTGVAHLAGTLGKPTWVLLPFMPDWRWLLGREDSPWYPSVKLYRQEKGGDWEGVLRKVHTDLSSLNFA